MLTPDFRPCKSVKEYNDSWQALLVPLCEKLNMHVVGYDPEISLVDQNNQYAHIRIPTWFAKRIVNAT